MLDSIPSDVERVARERIARNEAVIRHSLTCAARGNPLAAEGDPARLVRRLMAKNQMTREEAEATSLGIRAFGTLAERDQRALLRLSGQEGGAEAVWGQTIDFIGVAFLERGRRAARSVGRVAFRTGRGWGSGFLVTDRLFLTNHHVIPDAAAARELWAEFDYELDLTDNPMGVTRFLFEPDAFFVTDSVDGLDFTLIALGERAAGQQNLASYGYCALSDAPDKHAIGEVVNIVQHPAGRYKEVVVRENRLVARTREALHYVADTEPGSSGSPVFNNQWQPIALHHWGGPYHATVDDEGQRIPREVNEGLRVSSIVGVLRTRRAGLAAPQRALLDDALARWRSAVRPGEAYSEPSSDGGSGYGPRTKADGSISWVFPVEISVRSPLTTAVSSAAVVAQPAASAAATDGERALAPSTDYSDRSGYEPGFIPGHVVPLPALSPALARIAARNRQAASGDDPHELKYHHFSVKVNAERKLAFFAACNVDGARSKFIDRKTGAVSALDPSKRAHGLMEMLLAEGAEASENWYDDERVPGDVAGDAVYDMQNVPGFPTSSNATINNRRTLRMFQRGHLVRRLDPAWGTTNQALLAEADTFHFTNAAPQVGFFNMGQGVGNQPGTGGGKLWRAVENLVLRNARTMRTRVCSFTGPIFADDDREFRTIKVPGRFFKIAVWADAQGLRSLGMIADQRPVIEVWPEALFDEEALEEEGLGREAFQDPDELTRVTDFLTTIAKIEAATGLDFGSAVRNADVRAGEADTRPEHLDDVPLTPEAQPATKTSRARRKASTTSTERGTYARRSRRRRLPPA